MKTPSHIIKKDLQFDFLTSVTDLQEREVYLYFNFLTASWIESVRNIPGQDGGGELKLYTGISFSKTLVEVKTVICKNHSSTKTYVLPKNKQ